MSDKFPNTAHQPPMYPCTFLPFFSSPMEICIKKSKLLNTVNGFRGEYGNQEQQRVIDMMILEKIMFLPVKKRFKSEADAVSRSYRTLDTSNRCHTTILDLLKRKRNIGKMLATTRVQCD